MILHISPDEVRLFIAVVYVMISTKIMCRNIKTLYNFEPPATDDEIRAAAIQFVRKISGYNKPSTANIGVFEDAVDEITKSSSKLMESLVTSATPKDREREAEKAKERNRLRFGK